MHTTQRHGLVVSRGGKRKFVSRDKPLPDYLKGDGANGIGERPRSALGGLRKYR